MAATLGVTSFFETSLPQQPSVDECSGDASVLQASLFFPLPFAGRKDVPRDAKCFDLNQSWIGCTTRHIATARGSCRIACSETEAAGSETTQIRAVYGLIEDRRPGMNLETDLRPCSDFTSSLSRNKPTLPKNLKSRAFGRVRAKKLVRPRTLAHHPQRCPARPCFEPPVRSPRRGMKAGTSCV